MRKLLTLTIAVMWGAILLGGAFRPKAATLDLPPKPYTGYPAPALTAYDVAGKPIKLSDLKGKAVFLNFWASWCGPCRLEMPEIERLAGSLPPDTVLLTVNITTEETGIDVPQAFLKQNGYTFPVAYDPTGEVGAAYRVFSYPTSLFISPEGLVRARINGPLSRAAMADYLKAAGR